MMLLLYAEYADPVVVGRATDDSVCVALSGPLLPRLAVTFSVPSAMLTLLMDRLKTARAP